VGSSDGWTDLAGNFQMDWEFDHATDGNVALTGELYLKDHREFTLGLAFGDTQHHAIATLFQALSAPFDEHHKRFTEQWDRPFARVRPLAKFSSNNGNLYRSSYSLLLAHEDKSYPGAAHYLEGARTAIWSVTTCGPAAEVAMDSARDLSTDDATVPVSFTTA
jgi:glucoamylase